MKKDLEKKGVLVKINMFHHFFRSGCQKGVH
jgi:hypothetical protein